jgi:hypothetical protein
MRACAVPTRGGGMVTLRSAPDLEVEIVDPGSPRVARRALCELLGPHGSDSIGQSALLVCSELVNNALMHTTSGGWLSVWWIPDRLLRLELEDTDPTLPTLPSAPGVTQLHGRGLHIVDTVASRWGMHRSERGKTIWCELDVPES